MDACATRKADPTIMELGQGDRHRGDHRPRLATGRARPLRAHFGWKLPCLMPLLFESGRERRHAEEDRSCSRGAGCALGAGAPYEVAHHHGRGQAVAEQVKVGKESLPRWVNQADVDAGDRPGVTSSGSAEIWSSRRRTGGSARTTRSRKRPRFRRIGLTFERWRHTRSRRRDALGARRTHRCDHRSPGRERPDAERRPVVRVSAATAPERELA